MGSSGCGRPTYIRFQVQYYLVKSLTRKERVSLIDHSKYNPDRFKRKSIRLPDRDYAAKSAYFITIRSDQHQTLFEIPELRNILQETWKGLPKRFPSVSLDEFVIMPDHIHFILWL